MIKSPLNYIGGKFKLLPQILPLFPTNIHCFYDVFAGGCNVGLNVNSKVVFNDKSTHLIELYAQINQEKEQFKVKIDQLIEQYDLIPISKEKYHKLRDLYNQNQNPHLFFLLICFGYNHQIRFNQKGLFNNAYGKGRGYSENQVKNLMDLIEKMNTSDFTFWNKDFREVLNMEFKQDDFVYLDPPYLITDATYNSIWNIEVEKELYALLDRLNEKGIRFALSNVVEHKGKENEILIEWAKKYNLHYLDHTYSNASYNTKKEESKEVLITNY